LSKELVLSIEDLLDRAEREFLIEGRKDFRFPLRKKAGMDDFYSRLENEIRELAGLRILNFRSVREGFTSVSRPSEIGFDQDFLLKKRPYLGFHKRELMRFQEIYSSRLDVLQFVGRNFHDTVKDLGILQSSLEVLFYLLDHRDSIVGLLPRQVPHNQSTKLIGRENLLLRLFSYYIKKSGLQWIDFFSYFQLIDKPPEFRFFAPHCQLQGAKMNQLHGVLAPEWSAQYKFSFLNATLIVENLETFYSLAPKSKQTLLIWGGGWRLALIRGILSELPRPLYYWGDMDKEGYEIFAYLKKYAPETRPLLMDLQTLQKYRSIGQHKEPYHGPYREAFELQNEYELVSREGLQIEQEKLTEDWPILSDLN